MASLYVLNGRVNGLFIWTEIALLMALIPTLKWFCLPVCVCVCTCVCSLALSILRCSRRALSSHRIGNGGFSAGFCDFHCFMRSAPLYFSMSVCPHWPCEKQCGHLSSDIKGELYCFPPLPGDTLISDSLFTVSPQFEQNVSSLAAPLEITYWKCPSAEVWYYKFSGQLA